MKRPSFQFYPGDWLNDAALRTCSVCARGLWIEMVCLMHQGSEYGYLKINHKVISNGVLARLVGCSVDEVEGLLKELETAGVYSVDDQGCIFSRRMVKDETLRKIRADGGKLGGNPALMGGKNKVGEKVKQKSTPSSSSSSSSSSSKIYTPVVHEVLKFLNEKTGKNFRGADADLAFISARLEETGVDVDGVKKMIGRQCQLWMGTRMQEYLRPETLFNKTKFNSYYASKDASVELNDQKPQRHTQDPNEF